MRAVDAQCYDSIAKCNSITLLYIIFYKFFFIITRHGLQLTSNNVIYILFLFYLLIRACQNCQDMQLHFNVILEKYIKYITYYTLKQNNIMFL